MTASRKELERRVSDLEREKMYDHAHQLANQWHYEEKLTINQKAKGKANVSYHDDYLTSVRRQNKTLLEREIQNLKQEKAQLEFDKTLAEADDKVEYLASVIREKLVHL